MTTSTFVTIDWDFFIPHGMYEKDIFLPTQNVHMPGPLVFDWQMSETRAAEFENSIWEIRSHNFMEWGLDIVEMTKPPLAPEDFAMEISARLDDWSSPMTWHGDSHAWGAILAKQYSEQFGPLKVVNFDAHHDLGYRKNPLDEFHKNGRVQCDDWALAGLDKGWISDYTVVYPDWLGRNEWNEQPWRKDFRKRIHITTWTNWLRKQRHGLGATEIMYLCRSSSWTPPWLDDRFESLTEEFGWAECIDCNTKHKGPYDTCNVREWDWEAVNEHCRIRSEQIAELMARREEMEKLTK